MPRATPSPTPTTRPRASASSAGSSARRSAASARRSQEGGGEAKARARAEPRGRTRRHEQRRGSVEPPPPSALLSEESVDEPMPAPRRLRRSCRAIGGAGGRRGAAWTEPRRRGAVRGGADQGAAGGRGLPRDRGGGSGGGVPRRPSAATRSASSARSSPCSSSGSSSPSSSPSTATAPARSQVTIPKGASVSEVGDLLGEKGVIDSSTLFQVRVTLEGKRSELYAGHFTLAEGMSYGAAIDALSKPPVKTRHHGHDPRGLQPLAGGAAGRRRRPRRATTRRRPCSSKYLEPGQVRRQGRQGPRGLPLPRHLRTEAGRAGRRPGPAAAAGLQAADQGRRHELREVEEPDRLRRAHHRLDDRARGGRRRASASWSPRSSTTACTKGCRWGSTRRSASPPATTTKPLTESELAVDSPYNTRTNAGLPPGPINSPGLAAIEAAAHPAKSDYLFYVNKPNTCNELAFAKTEAEFEADVAKYNEAREANGGNEPSTCGE